MDFDEKVAALLAAHNDALDRRARLVAEGRDPGPGLLQGELSVDDFNRLTEIQLQVSDPFGRPKPTEREQLKTARERWDYDWTHPEPVPGPSPEELRAEREAAAKQAAFERRWREQGEWLEVAMNGGRPLHESVEID